MKSLCIIAVVVVAAPLWAGVRIKAEDTDLKTGKVSQQEVLIDADRMRVNEGPRGAFMFLTDNGRDRMVILDLPRNEYREIDRQTMNQVSQQMQGVMAQLQDRLKNLPPEQRAQMEKMLSGRMGAAGQAASAPRISYTATGSGSVAGFSCIKYEGMRGTEKVVDLCAAKPSDLHFNPADFQVFEKMREFSSGLLGNMANSPLPTDFLTQQGFEGYPLEQTNYEGGQPVSKAILKSIDRASFSDAEFSVGNARRTDFSPGPRR